ncbi:MAG: cytochrome c oxidase subunit II [candidate division KSB1 bacterium]|jgi:cytochrome c oxidase subunit 2|nr:cytochrome c oxidase subunit II [candidate division KSB1 bacterium]
MIIDASSMPQTVNNVFIVILAISVALLALITFLMIYFVIKYHRKKNTKPKDIEGNLVLEIVWTVIPTLLVLGMFYYGWIGYKIMREVPEDAMEIDVVGRMWAWEFEYENGMKTDTLYVPQNKAIKLNLRSQDVLHSFFIPAFRVKHDVVPGLENGFLWFNPTDLGSYDVLCTEFCGQEHAYMKTKVVVIPQEEYDSWYGTPADTTATGQAQSDEDSAEAPADNIPEGLALLTNEGCIACHTLDGTPMVATSFKGLFGRKQIVISNGVERRITIDDEYFKKSIVEPGADIVKGYDNMMPVPDEPLSEDDMKAMIAYIKGL